jgi:AraC-like DNA-binding protein
VPRLVESPPSGFTSLVVNYGSTYKAGHDILSAKDVSMAFLAGQLTHRYQIWLEGQVGMAGVVFKPGGMAAFFNIPMYELTGERVCFECIFGKKGRELVEKIGNSRSHEQKTALLDQFLVNQLQQIQPGNRAIHDAANRIFENNGIVKMDDLLHVAFMSRRNFERKFLEQVGVSPKYYARLRRVSRICHLMNTLQTIDWQYIMGEGDYYDQAHFIKDFKDFMGMAPSVYAKVNVELFRFLNEH